MSETQNNPQFAIQKIFTENLSFESPLAPQVFKQKFTPKGAVDVQTAAELLKDDQYLVKLTLTVTTKNDEDKVIFIAEVKQSGIFALTDFNVGQLDHAVKSFCPAILFPYAKEAISSLVSRGGFPDLQLAPINFDALYLNEMAQKQKATGAQ